MSNIDENLKKIESAVWGKDVRKAIHDSIHDCYEDGKAGTTDLIARERINNLSKMKEGSTTGDAELQDIRIGADGKEYPNAGEAVRGQLSELKEDIGDSVGVVTLKFVDGYYIDLAGNSANVKLPIKSDDWEHLVCECKGGDKFTLTGKGGEAPRLWAFANSDGEIIQKSEVSAVEKKFVVAAPQNATTFVMHVTKGL